MSAPVKRGLPPHDKGEPTLRHRAQGIKPGLRKVSWDSRAWARGSGARIVIVSLGQGSWIIYASPHSLSRGSPRTSHLLRFLLRTLILYVFFMYLFCILHVKLCMIS